MAENEFDRIYNARVAEVVQERSRLAGFPNLLGISIDSFGPGFMTCSVTVDEKHMNAVGTVHGGVVAALIDHTLSVAVYPLVEVGKWVATMEFKVNYLRAVTGGKLVATGRVRSLRRATAVVTVDVECDGEVCAMAQGTLYIKDRG